MGAHKDWKMLKGKPLCTPEGLNHFVNESLTSFLSGQRYRLDCHLLPQSEFIWGSLGKQWCDDILRISDLPDAFDELMERKGFTARMAKEKVNSHREACPVYAKDPDPLSRELVRAVYGTDFAKLGYSMQP